MVDDRSRRAADSRSTRWALRRVDRHQALLEVLHAGRGERVELAVLASDLRVSVRTLARDVERLRAAGVPVVTFRGRGGGVALAPVGDVAPVRFDVVELATVMAALTEIGPGEGGSAASAMAKLRAALLSSGSVGTSPSPDFTSSGRPTRG